MRNFLEKFLISFLLATSVLLGLSFWLNIKYGFNIFSSQHWAFLSQLQASHTTVSYGFYVSFVVAFCIFIVGLIAIFTIKHQSHIQQTPIQKQPAVQQQPVVQQQPEQTQPAPEPQQPSAIVSRPPRLHLPKNMAQIAAMAHEQQKNTPVQQTTNNGGGFTPTTSSYTQPTQKPAQESPYNSVISDIMTNAGYLVKPNPMISGFTSNVFAIGNNEIVWIGGVDCDINTLKNAVKKLNSTFEDTLEDITIHVNPFVLDTAEVYEDDDTVLIFHDIDELKDFMSKHPADEISEDEQESFDAYSEYIDTIIKYVRNI